MSKEKRSRSAGGGGSPRKKKKARETGAAVEAAERQPAPADAAPEPEREQPAAAPAPPTPSIAWMVMAFLPLAGAVAAGMYPSVVGADRGVVWAGLATLAAALGAMMLFIPLAWADARLPVGQRVLWTVGLVLATSLAAPAFWFMQLRQLSAGGSTPRSREIADASARASERWLPRARGATTALLGLGAMFLLMANEEQLERGPLWGMVAFLVGLAGLLDAFGIARRDGEPVSWRETTFFAREGEPIWMSPVVTAPLALAIVVVGAAVGGYERLPVTIVLALAALAVSAVRRPGLLVFVVAGALYLPFLGVYGLWDPWETHYGEVAREMLSRDDWISLWWAQEDWFWSKPILIFWSEALSMGALGVDYHPDANPAHPEWAIRLPHFLLATGALLSVYALLSRVWSKRAGAVGALVLATMPHFFFLAHQAITDMPFVACMTMAMCMLGLALVEDPEREVKRYALGPLRVSGRHVMIAAISAVVLPQVLYLFSRNVTFMESLPPFGWHADVFLHGSAGNHGVPGNSPVHNVEPFLSGPAAQPAVQALLWLGGFVLILALLARERRAQSLYVFAFYLFCGLAFMAKGIPGFALPGLVALLFLIGSRRWDILLTGRLRVASGMLIVLVTGLPWYVAMYIRHGPPFTERLLIHDHINRLTAGVHGDTGSIEYFVEQLGYGLFPWIALAPLALAAWRELGEDRTEARSPDRSSPPVAHGKALRNLSGGGLGAVAIGAAVLRLGLRLSRPEIAEGVALGFIAAGAAALVVALAVWLYRNPAPLGYAPPVGKRGVLLLVTLWLASAFTLFSAMTTKFHHYIFPCVPAAGILVGVALDRMLGPRAERFDLRVVGGTVLAAIAPAPAVLGVAGIWGDVRGVVPEEIANAQATEWVMAHPWSPAASIACIGLGLALFAAAAWILRPQASARVVTQWKPAAVTTGLLAAPVLVALVGRDLSWVTDARPQGYERLIQLFVYNYGRPWPEHLDYRPILTGFAIVATIVLLLAAARPLRGAATRAYLGVALAFAVWSLDVYMIDLSPHWGQRELVQRYYELRTSADEPLVAWQMNWKGENFYTGNRVSVFVQLDNRELNEWVRRNSGRTAYFLLEHSRLGSLRGVLRDSPVEPITSEHLNNKFILVRAHIGRREPPTPAARETLD